MRFRIAAWVVLAAASSYAGIVLSYGAALRASTARVAVLLRAGVEDGRLMAGASQLESQKNVLAAKLARLTLVSESRGFDILLQRIAVVARRSHVAIAGLTPDGGETREPGASFADRSIVIRIRGSFAETLQFIRLLPVAGILLRVRSVAISSRNDPGSTGALDVTLRSTLLRPLSIQLHGSPT